MQEPEHKCGKLVGIGVRCSGRNWSSVYKLFALV
jgi:hypothetical protein